jgi:hypothetical protein
VPALELAAGSSARIARIDTGSANGYPFFNAMGLGLDADVDGRPSVVPLSDLISGPTVGVVVGLGFNPNNLNIDGQFRPSAAQTSNRIVYVVDDHNFIF